MVTEIITRGNSYREAFRALQESQPDSPGSWLTRLRESAMESFQELGFPSVKDEEWKYTNVAPIARIDFTPAKSATTANIGSDGHELAAFEFVEAKHSQLVFINGQLRSDLSSLTDLPPQVVTMDLSQAISDERYGEIAWRHLAQQADLGRRGCNETIRRDVARLTEQRANCPFSLHN